MSDLASILGGLVANRRLTPRVPSRASGRAEPMIRQPLTGTVPPRVELRQDIAPAMRMPVVDLLVIVGLPVDEVPARKGPYAASQEIGALVAVAGCERPRVGGAARPVGQHATGLDRAVMLPLSEPGATTTRVSRPGRGAGSGPSWWREPRPGRWPTPRR